MAIYLRTDDSQVITPLLWAKQFKGFSADSTGNILLTGCGLKFVSNVPTIEAGTVNCSGRQIEFTTDSTVGKKIVYSSGNWSVQNGLPSADGEYNIFVRINTEATTTETKAILIIAPTNYTLSDDDLSVSGGVCDLPLYRVSIASGTFSIVKSMIPTNAQIIKELAQGMFVDEVPINMKKASKIWSSCDLNDIGVIHYEGTSSIVEFCGGTATLNTPFTDYPNGATENTNTAIRDERNKNGGLPRLMTLCNNTAQGFGVNQFAFSPFDTKMYRRNYTGGAWSYWEIVGDKEVSVSSSSSDSKIWIDDTNTATGTYGGHSLSELVEIKNELIEKYNATYPNNNGQFYMVCLNNIYDYGTSTGKKELFFIGKYKSASEYPYIHYGNLYENTFYFGVTGVLKVVTVSDSYEEYKYVGSYTFKKDKGTSTFYTEIAQKNEAGTTVVTEVSKSIVYDAKLYYKTAMGYTPITAKNIGAEPETKHITEGTNITLEDRTEYKLTVSDSLTISYPSGYFECWMYITTAETAPTITLPTSTYIGKAPSFGASETWELSIKNGVIAAQKVGDGT